VALGAVALVLAGPAPPYPLEDVRPLVAQAERERGAGEPLIVYPSTIWAYALYTSAPVTLRANPASPWGFSPQVNDTTVILLEPSRDRPDRYVAPVMAAAQGAQRVWLLSSHQRADLAAIKDALRAAGLTIGQDLRGLGAAVQVWR
jgi:hypothetical protein